MRKLSIDITLEHRKTYSQAHITGTYTFNDDKIPDVNEVKGIICDCNGLNNPDQWRVLVLNVYPMDDDTPIIEYAVAPTDNNIEYR